MASLVYATIKFTFNKPINVNAIIATFVVNPIITFFGGRISRGLLTTGVPELIIHICSLHHFNNKMVSSGNGFTTWAYLFRFLSFCALFCNELSTATTFYSPRLGRWGVPPSNNVFLPFFILYCVQRKWYFCANGT